MSQAPGRYLKIRDVIEQTSLSRATIWRMIKRGEFPASRKLSPQRVGWAERDIEAWKLRQDTSHHS